LNEPVTIMLGGTSREKRARKYCDGRVVVTSPAAPSPTFRLLLEALEGEVKGDMLVVGMAQWSQTVLSLAIQGLHPHINIDMFSFEAFEQQRVARTFRFHNASAVNCLLGADLPSGEFYDWVVLSIPRRSDKALTGETLRQVWSCLRPKGKIVISVDNSRDRWLRNQIDEIFGATTIATRNRSGVAYVARKKPGSRIRERRYERRFEASLFGVDMELESRPGVFSHGEIDEGTLALSEVAEIAPNHRIVDMGCGCGALGIAAALQSIWCRVILVDSNIRAVETTRRNVVHNAVERNALVLPGFDLGAVRAGTIDRVLANPPYYGSFLISQLFIEESARILKPGGELYLVTKAPDEHCLMLEKVFGEGDIIERRGYTVFRVAKP
jgi:16S rRNA (guanine1207-N2)-methyltransferase